MAGAQWNKQVMPGWGRAAKGVMGAMVGKILGDWKDPPNDGGSLYQTEAFGLCLTEHWKP